MTRRNTRWLLACAELATAAAAVLALTACGGGGGSHAPAPTATATAQGQAAADTIVIKSFMFQPASLTVAPGATVSVHNEDSVTHTLTDKANPKLFGTGDVGPGQTKTFTAPSTAGSYAYICLIHQFMAGTLVVK
jgi:plastocyanin